MDINDIVTKEGEGGYNGYVTNFAGSGLSYGELLSLTDLANQVKRRRMVCIDVGVAKGSSSAAMGFVAKEMDGIVYSVDDYREYKKHVDQWSQVRCSDIFLNNMKQLGLNETVRLMEQSSEEAHKEFQPGQADIVFIDANHHYDAVRRDIKNWLPIVRKGGIICGHDCQVLSKDGSVDIRKWQNISQETTGYDQQDFHWHVGVILAVGDMLPSARIIGDTSIWWKVV